MYKSSWKFMLIIALLAIMVGCNKPSSSDTTAPQSSAETTVNTAAPSSPNVESSIAVDEAKLQEVLAQFNDKTPAKVVTLSVSISELLGELDIIPVGVPTTSSQLPAAFDQVQRVGSSHKPDLEQIATLQPDIILVPASLKDSMGKMFAATSLPLAYLPVDSLEELKLTTVALGKVFQQESKAEAFLQTFTQAEQTVLEDTKGKTPPSVMLLFGSAESLMFMNEDTYAGSLVKSLGASNVVSDVLKLKETYVPINMENVAAANPDVILLVVHGDPEAAIKAFEEDTKKNGAWEKLNAVQNDKLIALDYDLFGIASLVKAPDAYKELEKILYN